MQLQHSSNSDTKNFEQLKEAISECGKLLQSNLNIFYRCVYIVEHIDKPWSHETLKLILNEGKDGPKTISDELLCMGRFSLNSLFVSNRI